MVNIEIDGIPLKVDETKMIIQAADEAGIDIPRFCYHKKLSIAANCRMCLVEVDKARKPMPACATPVAEGMKVFTASHAAKQAQRSVMEFLLINHPLDCPICDQGGECELQDLSMGYGEGVSRFNEGKRVVKDKDIGPLIQTEMTRCIHCTRCVRFGQEIAGIKELGATGRGEHMEIGTYVKHSLASELSGNIIDLCPVGALTSKPFRYKARAWEMVAHPSVAPHDAVGSNIELHVRKNQVMRVVPRDNEVINESWISDRDRFSYLGLTHADRLSQPMIKKEGNWHPVEWHIALEYAVEGLKAAITKYGVQQTAGLISPVCTLEESYLLNKWLTGLGVSNIDYRLRQQDFRDQNVDDTPSDWSLEDIEQSQAVLLLGSNIRSEQPIIAHRIRQAALMGSAVTDINFMEQDLLMPVKQQIAVNAQEMTDCLAGIAKALAGSKAELASEWQRLLPDRVPTAFEQNVAMQLANAMRATVIVGDLINHHPQASVFRALARLISELSGSQLLVLPIANATAHRLTQSLSNEQTSNAAQYWQDTLRAYVLMGFDPLRDTADPDSAQKALQKAGFVVALDSFSNETMLEYADVILPMSCFSETSGTFIGVDGQWQRFSGAAEPYGDSRPGWKILRVLGNVSKLNGFDYVSSQDVVDEINTKLKITQAKTASSYIPPSLKQSGELMLLSEVPMYRTDALVRHSEALQQTPEALLAEQVRMHPAQAEALNLCAGDTVLITQGSLSVTSELVLDKTLAQGCIYLAATTALATQLGPMFAEVSVTGVTK